MGNYLHSAKLKPVLDLIMTNTQDYHFILIPEICPYFEGLCLRNFTIFISGYFVGKFVARKHKDVQGKCTWTSSRTG